MLLYFNPKFENFSSENNSVLNFRKKDWSDVPKKIESFFKGMCSISSLSFESFEIIKSYGQLRKEIRDTDLDYKIKVRLKNNLNNINIDLTILLPKMKDFGFTVNGVKRFLTMQLTDKNVVKRNNQIRINSCLRDILVQIKDKNIKNPKKIFKESYRYFYKYTKNKKIPLFMIILSKYNFTDLENKYKIKLKVNTLKDKNSIKFMGDKINFISDDKILIDIFNDLNCTPILDRSILEKDLTLSETWRQYITDNYNIDIIRVFDEIYEIDPYLKTFIKNNNIIDEILYGLTLEEDKKGINLENKRIRISEYIIGYILNDIYNSIFLNLKNIKKDIKRNYNVNELLSGKFQELFQMSKVEDNLIGRIMELFKITITGPGGIPAKSININYRNIDNSFYNIIDPIFTSDGEKCGIVNYLTISCQLDENGCFKKINF